ncbi:hypothetical protein NDU88_003771 [Pleurodeles waltl]|uniref:Uncharacterized protein n=1 Tax=Pleurodeles waltl TaxID=8319 RepID=A0AAV7W338_PLEWA|nr:hypothetical protein NDU88_003771 [Pleurodeles waltl]
MGAPLGSSATRRLLLHPLGPVLGKRPARVSATGQRWAAPPYRRPVAAQLHLCLSPVGASRVRHHTPGENRPGPPLRLEPNAQTRQRLPAPLEAPALRGGAGRGPPPQSKGRIHTPAHLGVRTGAQLPPGPVLRSPLVSRHWIARRRHTCGRKLSRPLRSEGIKRASSPGSWPRPQMCPTLRLFCYVLKSSKANSGKECLPGGSTPFATDTRRFLRGGEKIKMRPCLYLKVGGQAG